MNRIKSDSSFTPKPKIFRLLFTKNSLIISVTAIILFASVLLVLYTSRVSQKKQQSIRTQAMEIETMTIEHPRILFSKNELSVIKSRALSKEKNKLGVSYADILKNIIAAADNYEKKPFSYSVTFYCEQGGTRTYNYNLNSSPPTSPVASECYFPVWTNLVRALMRRVEILSLAHILTANSETEQTKYFIAVRNDMQMIRAWNVWHDPQDRASLANLDTAYLTRATALMYDLTYNTISPDERDQIEKALIEKGINPIYQKLCPPPDFRCSPERYEKSPNPLFFMTGSLGIATAAIHDKLPGQLDQLLQTINTNINYTMNNLVPLEGGTYEDFVYLSAFDYIIEAINALELNNLSIAAVPQINQYIQNTSNLIVSSLDNTGFTPNINDSVKIHLSDFSTFLFYDLKKNSTDGQIVEAIKKFSDRFNTATYLLLWYDNNSGNDTGTLNWNPQFFKEMGLGVLKNPIDPASVIYIKTPPLKSTSHQHFDIGGISYITNGSCLICDPGRPKNTVGYREYGISTLGHNSILIDGQGQNWTTKGSGTMIDRQNYTAFKVNMIGNYDSASNENTMGLKNIYRVIMTSKNQGNNFVVLLDYFKSEKSHIYTQLFHNKTATFSWDSLNKKLLIDTPSNDTSIIFLSSPQINYELRTPPTSVPSDFDGKYAAISTNTPSTEAYSGAIIFNEPVEILNRQNDLINFKYRGVDSYLIFNPSKVQKVFFVNGKKITASSTICILQDQTITNFDGPCSLQ